MVCDAEICEDNIKKGLQRYLGEHLSKSIATMVEPRDCSERLAAESW